MGKDARKQYGFLFMQQRCNGCKTCEMACKDYHHLDGGLALRTIYEFSGGEWKRDSQGAWSQDVFSYHLSVSCNHCSNPLCKRICPTQALEQDERGFISINPETCSGCQSCVIACPYHAPRFDEKRGVSVKCDGCGHRLDAGLKPICVEACPQHAILCLSYDEMREKLIEGNNRVNSLSPLPDPIHTQPNLVIDTCPTARKASTEQGTLINIREA